eukprot:Skav230050  [mRNA]  locus=scaffold1221:30527:38471:+ [translate_table: standard]
MKLSMVESMVLLQLLLFCGAGDLGKPTAAPTEMRETFKEIAGQAKFWRLAAVTGIFIGAALAMLADPGVRMTFRHVDATFPKYFIRTYGPQATADEHRCWLPREAGEFSGLIKEQEQDDDGEGEIRQTRRRRAALCGTAYKEAPLDSGELAGNPGGLSVELRWSVGE